jgi:hypothetical protein
MKTPIAIYRGHKYSPGMGIVVCCGGGEDADVCVQVSNIQNNCPQYHAYGVPSTVTWSGAPGYADPNNPTVFHIRPTEPGTYTMSVTSKEGSSACNVGNEQVSASACVVVYEFSGIHPLAFNTVNRGSSQDFYIVLRPPLPYEVRWTSSVTTATGSGLSWGGEHCKSYTLRCEARTTCPCTNEVISKSFVKMVDVVKGRTFNCTPTNTPKRYPVPPTYRGTQGLLGDACATGLYGVCWDWPWSSGDAQGTSMSLHAVVKHIGDNGPNNGWFYVQNLEAPFIIDTNTNVSFTSQTTTWYAQHTTMAAELHADVQRHEERHYANIVTALRLQTTEAIKDITGTKSVTMRTSLRPKAKWGQRDLAIFPMTCSTDVRA